MTRVYLFRETIYKKWLIHRYQNLALPQEITFLLESLRKRFRIGLITNGTSAAQWEKIDKLNLRRYFDVILVSGDLPYEKPDKSIFLQACDFLDIKPKHCLMVGDKLETDIQGGINAEFGGTVWIPLGTRHDLVESDPQPQYILKDVTDLKCFLLSPQEFDRKLASLKTHRGNKNRAANLSKLMMSSLYIDFNSDGEIDSFSHPISSSSNSKYKPFNRVLNLDEDCNSNASDGS